ncbi:MAG: adenylate/guanylate cyclase family protein, partial [Mycobacterium sp.]|nr:adenylate/guanylate cyclase family protein [Mycobacterium sp.]
MAENHRACASCGTANEEDARFCEGCGGALRRACGTCGVEANATARFCRACGAPLEGQTTPSPEGPAAGPSRKTVTVMFADLAGSTTFEEGVDAETAREVMSRYHDLLRSTAERNRAGVTKYIGDGFMAVWGVPEIGPDDADHAVDAAVELQEHFIDFAARVTEARGVDLALRVAVNTGEVVVGAGDADLVGDALNVAARLEAECPRGRVVVGEETWRSTRGRHRYESLGHVQVKGRTAPVPVYQWLGRQSESTDSAPFVGRADEIRRLQTALDDAIAAQAARLVTVIGDPGVGKSRLAAEFTAAQGDVRVVEARCDVEGTVALAPIVEVLRARDLETDVPAGVPERDRILRDLNGLTTGVPGSVEETFWALRRYVEVLARDGPLIVVVDDIQWADTLLLDFVEHLAEWVREVPVLVLALARPELREVRADLIAVSRWVTEAVHLGGLDPGATAELAAGVLGAGLPEELLRRLPSSTGGNPLFVRELVGMLVHDGVLVAEPAGWRLTIDVDAIAIPPTIQALLASRLERLNAEDRRVLEVASVVGTDFSLGVVCALAARGSKDVKASLDRLRRLDLAQPSGAYLGDEPIWRFHHVLIRDVAYRRLLKSDRAGLHERLADWVEAGGASVAFDADEMIARHLEAAHGYRLELGTADEHTGQLALRSARCYLASARRALDRDELISAGTQAARGAALAAADNAVHAELLLVGCEAFLSAGDVAAGAPLVDDLDRIVGEELAPWATCYRCQFVVYTDPARLLEVDARLQGAIDEFGRRKDPAGLAKAHRVRASARARLGRIGDAEVDLFEALIAARQGGDHRQITAALGMAPAAALWGPSPVPKAGGRCLDVVRMQRMTTAAPSLEATSLRCLAVLELLRGRPDKARSMLADAREVVADLGLRHGLMETELFAGMIESMVGDQVAAEPHFRTAMEGMDALGVGADAGQAAALLARSVLAQGRVDEADRYAAESERLAGHNLKTAIAWRAVRAEILAAQGRNDAAAAMARDAVNVAVGTDLVLDHAEACFALSRVLASAGDAKGAKDARDDAHKLYGAKEVATTIGRLTEPNVPVASQPIPTAPAPTTSRLAVTNQSCEF